MKVVLLGAMAMIATAAAAASPPPAFGVCSACHSPKPGMIGIGPSLFGVVGRKAGSQPGFSYSPALAKAGFVWTPARLDAFIAAPQKAVPGNKMPYAGMSDPKSRAAIIEYLATLK